MEAAAHRGRQHAGDFVQPGLQELDDVQGLILLGLHFLAHAREAGLAGLQVSHADHVLEAHP
jgi:hypothetical protein